MSTVDVATDPRPRPQPDPVTAFYWEAAAQGRLAMQHCRHCDQLQFPPDVCCVHCQSQDLDTKDVSGRGTLYSWAVVDRAMHAGFAGRLPYVVALVELDEQPGLRLVTNLVEVPDGTELRAGLPLEVVFEDRGEVVLPQFRLVGAES